MTEILARLQQLLTFDPATPMLFNSGLFLIVFALFLCAYQLTMRFSILRKWLVILFSLFFYYKSGGACVLILVGVTVSDFLLGLAMEQAQRNWLRRSIVGLNVVMNVGMLVYFKYFNLLADAFNSIIGRSFDPLEIILPAGISFFTFRSISYIVDLYRGVMKPTHSFLNYAFFLTFFPPILAGPVVRAKDILPQIESSPCPSHADIAEALFLIMIGMIKKVVIADYISGNFVDRIFDNPLLYSGFENLMGAIAFTVQLYCDFSGYSDMAIGLALLLGYRFADNFQAPFKAQSPTEFWHRWHISLSTWLRDYIYIPLGGNRKGKGRAKFNQFMTMVIGGLWHGASWMYVIWGAYHGLLLVLHKWLKSWWPTPEFLKGSLLARAFNMTLTFLLVVAGFTLFRAPSLEVVGQMFTQIFTAFNPAVAPAFLEGYLLIVIAMATGLLAHLSPRSWTRGVGSLYISMPLLLQALLLAAVIFFVIQARQSELVPFIYLQY